MIQQEIDMFYNGRTLALNPHRSQCVIMPVAVEKLIPAKFAKTKLRYERSSPIARHFLSPKFWPFETKSEFFNISKYVGQCQVV